MTPYLKLLIPSLAAIVLPLAACSSTPSSPSDTTTTVSPVTQIFAGTLSPMGTSTYSLILVQESTVALTLASIATVSTGAATPVPMGIALGTADEAGTCVHANEAVVSPGLTAHLTVTAPAATRCVELFDSGSLKDSVAFAVRIVVTPVSGTLAPPTASAGSDSFASNVPVLGAASRAIEASQAGTLTVNLTSLAPADAVIGLGVGVPRASGGGCFLTMSLDATTGTQPLSVTVDRGTYCVRVYDSGLLKAPATFTLTTAHP
jgi:hypothetical protein